MIEWLLGMAGVLAIVLILFNPRSFLYGLVALFVVGFLCPSPGGEYALTACAIASWVGLLTEIYRNMDFNK